MSLTPQTSQGQGEYPDIYNTQIQCDRTSDTLHNSYLISYK